MILMLTFSCVNSDNKQRFKLHCSARTLFTSPDCACTNSKIITFITQLLEWYCFVLCVFVYFAGHLKTNWRGWAGSLPPLMADTNWFMLSRHNLHSRHILGWLMKVFHLLRYFTSFQAVLMGNLFRIVTLLNSSLGLTNWFDTPLAVPTNFRQRW